MVEVVLNPNLFFASSPPRAGSVVIARARRAVKLVVMLGFAMMLAGGVLVVFASFLARGFWARVEGLAAGIPLLYMGSHIVWAGLGSLAGLDERLEGVEVVE